MAHVFEGEPDSRQANEPIVTSRFRPRYRRLTNSEKELHDQIKDKAVELEVLFMQVREGRYRSLALTDLESAVMWVVKELTA